MRLPRPPLRTSAPLLAALLCWLPPLAQALPLQIVDVVEQTSCAGLVGMSSCYQFQDFGTYGSGDAQANVTTTLGRVPKISVLAIASTNGVLTGFSPQMVASAVGTITYEVSLEEELAPPLGVSLQVVPVRVIARGSGQRGSAPSTWSSRVRVGASGASFPLFELIAGDSVSPGFDTSFPLVLVPGSAYEVTLITGCTAWVPTNVTDTQICDSFVDPEFVLDQAAFDASQGANTFPLADYYSFHYSPGLIPEPDSALLLAAALVGLTRLARRR